MHFLPIYFAFAAGYLLSYLYRTVNAVISPELVRDLALNPSSLGILTSAYFLAFAAMQVPVGVLLDRFGPRRVEPVLPAIAASGAALFAYAESLAGLALARAVIGASVCACLMAPLNEGFGGEVAGRTNTTLNLVMFVGSFLAQWGIGIVVDLMRVAYGVDEAAGLRVAFAVILVGDIVTYAWFAYGWKRHRFHVPAAAIA